MSGGKKKSGGGRKKSVVVSKSELEKRGWYRDDKGRWCYKGQCFDMRVNSNGEIVVELDPTCDIGDENGKPVDAIIKALMTSGKTTYKVKPPADEE